MGTLLTSAVVIAALVSALFSMLTAERRIAAENIIQERKNWRDKIRKLTLEVPKALALGDVAKLNALRASFSLLVNPHDNMDQEILQLIDASNASRAHEFTQRVALLLKHDWERAKYEASLLWWLCKKKPERVRFKCFEPGDEHKYRAWSYGKVGTIWLFVLLAIFWLYQCTHFFASLWSRPLRIVWSGVLRPRHSHLAPVLWP